MLLAVNDIFLGSSMFDSYFCLGAHERGAGSEKDPSAAVRGLVALGRLCAKEDHAGRKTDYF